MKEFDREGHLVLAIMSQAAKTYEERRGTYGASERKFGEVMHALYPEGVTISSQEDWVRFGLLIQMVSKLCRYSNDPTTGHVDSVHDLGVYSFMLEVVDQAKKQTTTIDQMTNTLSQWRCSRCGPIDSTSVWSHPDGTHTHIFQGNGEHCQGKVVRS